MRNLQTLRANKLRILRIKNFQGIVFIWTRTYRKSRNCYVPRNFVTHPKPNAISLLFSPKDTKDQLSNSEKFSLMFLLTLGALKHRFCDFSWSLQEELILLIKTRNLMECKPLLDKNVQLYPSRLKTSNVLGY